MRSTSELQMPVPSTRSRAYATKYTGVCTDVCGHLIFVGVTGIKKLLELWMLKLGPSPGVLRIRQVILVMMIMTEMLH